MELKFLILPEIEPGPPVWKTGTLSNILRRRARVLVFINMLLLYSPSVNKPRAIVRTRSQDWASAGSFRPQRGTESESKCTAVQRMNGQALKDMFPSSVLATTRRQVILHVANTYLSLFLLLLYLSLCNEWDLHVALLP